MSTALSNSSQGDLFPALLSTLDYLDQTEQARRLAQRLAPICADEGHLYSMDQIQGAAALILAGRDMSAGDGETILLSEHEKSRPATRAAIQAARDGIEMQWRADRRKKWKTLLGGGGGLMGVTTFGFWCLSPHHYIGISLAAGALLSCFITSIVVTLWNDDPLWLALFKMREKSLGDEDWISLAASSQASALYRAWTAGDEPITIEDWKMITNVAEAEAGAKAKLKVFS